MSGGCGVEKENVIATELVGVGEHLVEKSAERYAEAAVLRLKEIYI